MIETAEARLVPGMPFAEYLSAPGANFSTLKHFARTPAHARHLMLHPEEQTAAQNIGQALHCAVLEPERFPKEYAVGPATMLKDGEEVPLDRRTTVGKATWKIFEAEHPGATLLKAAEWEMISGIQESVLTHPFASELLANARHKEAVVLWSRKVEPYGWVECKARLDIVAILAGWTFVGDLKSEGDYLTDASSDGFSKSIANHHYHAQAAFYLDAMSAIAEHERRFAWIAAEKEPPYLCAVHEPDDQMIEQGRFLYEGWLATYARCQQTGEYPGYDAAVSYVSLPPWSVREF